jgi:basic membrane lipoprotein Med (substrate-binding protein (PBP1-ABC) superfamily)
MIQPEARSSPLSNIDQGADINFVVASPKGVGVLEAAKSTGTSRIAVDSNQDDIVTVSILTMTKHLDTQVFDMVRAVAGNSRLAEVLGTESSDLLKKPDSAMPGSANDDARS